MLEMALSKRYGDFHLDVAVDGLDHGITALSGRSGSGKTTLVNLLAGLERPDQGRVVIGEQVLTDTRNGIHMPPERRGIGYVFQEHRLFPHMTVRANLEYGAKLLPPSARRIGFDQVVSLLDVDTLLGRYPNRLSGGERQRIAIGRALLTSPRILLMDEPLASLDAPRKAEILPFIERLRDEFRIPIIYVSHHLEEIVRLADNLILLADGKLVASGSVEELTSRLDLLPHTGRYEAGAVIATTVLRHDDEDGVTTLSFDGGVFTVPLLDDPIGTDLRFRVRSRDVSLALTPPVGTSVLNILPGIIEELADDGRSRVEVRLRLGAPPGTTRLLARVTRKACRELSLAPGKKVHAMIKAMSANRRALGRIGADR